MVASLNYNTQKAINVVEAPFNLIQKIRNLLVSEEFKLHYRLLTGIVIVFLGISVSKIGLFFHYQVFHIFFEGLGYMLHGIGSLPVIYCFFPEKKNTIPKQY